jgi:hypothetical protein
MSRGRTAFVVVALAGFAVAPASVRADSGPVIVIPSRPGVPVIINGRDASYAVVEGDWGLSRPGAVPVTVIGGSPVLPNEVYRRRNAYIPSYGRAPERGRYEVEPPADRALPEPAESFSRSWSTSSDPTPATITDPATFPNNGNINGALINNNSNNRNSGNTNTNSNNSQNTNYNNSTISNSNTNSNNASTSTNNTNSNNTSNSTNNTNTNSNNNNTSNSNNNSSRNNTNSNNNFSNNNSRRHYR